MCKILWWSDELSLCYSDDNFCQILNSIEVSPVGCVPCLLKNIDGWQLGPTSGTNDINVLLAGGGLVVFQY